MTKHRYLHLLQFCRYCILPLYGKIWKKAKRSKQHTYGTLTLDDYVEYYKELADDIFDNANVNTLECIRNENTISNIINFIEEVYRAA